MQNEQYIQKRERKKKKKKKEREMVSSDENLQEWFMQIFPVK